MQMPAVERGVPASASVATQVGDDNNEPAEHRVSVDTLLTGQASAKRRTWVTLFRGTPWERNKMPSPRGFTTPSLRALKVLAVILLASAILATALAFHFSRAAEIHRFKHRFQAACTQAFASLQMVTDAKVTVATQCSKQLALFQYLDRPNVTMEIMSGLTSVGMDILTVTQGQRLSWVFLVEDASRADFESIMAEAVADGTMRDNETHFWQFDERHQTVAAPRAPLYAIVWVRVPLAPTGQLFNYMGDPTYASAISHSIMTNQTTVSDVLPRTASDPADAEMPSSFIFAPAWLYEEFSVGEATTTLQRALASSRGSACGYSFHWAIAVRDALNSLLNSAVVTLQSANGVVSSFVASKGEVTEMYGYDARARAVPAALRKYECKGSLRVGGWSAPWRVSIYPTTEQWDFNITSHPVRDALIITSLLFLCILIFAAYELVVRRRDARVKSTLRKQINEVMNMRRSLDEAHEREAQAEALLVEGNTAVSDEQRYVATVSHEIRTPLNSVTGASSLLAQSDNLTALQRELIDLLQAGAAQVTLIIDDVLQFAALSSGQFPLACEPVLLTSSRGLLEQALRMVNMTTVGSTATKIVHTSLVVEPGTPDIILTDAGRLLQVITNLLGNARKFVPSGGNIRLRVDVIETEEQRYNGTGGAEVQTQENLRMWRPISAATLHSLVTSGGGDSGIPPPPPVQRWLRVKVIDDGIGIEPHHLERIFRPFTQEDSTTMREFGGTGLGLSICQRIISAMGGYISASSAGRGQGSTFTFRVPLQLPTAEMMVTAQPKGELSACASAVMQIPPTPAPSVTIAGSASPTARTQVSDRRLRILVAEDDVPSQMIIKRLLGSMGCDVICVDNGAAAVSAYQTDVFDLVLTDLHMPVLDGLATSNAICALGRRGERPITPVVALSASCSPEVIQRCHEAGMVSHVSKPVNAERLRTVLRECMSVH